MVIPAVAALLLGSPPLNAAPPSGISLLAGAELRHFPMGDAPAAAFGPYAGVGITVAGELALGMCAGRTRSAVSYDRVGGAAAVPVTQTWIEAAATWRLVGGEGPVRLHVRAGGGLVRLHTEAQTLRLGALGDRVIPAGTETRAVTRLTLPVVFHPGGPLRLEFAPGFLAAPWADVWRTQFTCAGGIGVTVL